VELRAVVFVTERGFRAGLRFGFGLGFGLGFGSKECGLDSRVKRGHICLRFGFG
jgi:hypothetical protein